MAPGCVHPAPSAGRPSLEFPCQLCHYRSLTLTGGGGGRVTEREGSGGDGRERERKRGEGKGRGEIGGEYYISCSYALFFSSHCANIHHLLYTTKGSDAGH